jgi:predicted translin family RNA/ssDNA-binding protein
LISRECQILLLDLHKQGKERAERELEETELEISSLKKENKTQSQLIEELHDQVGIPLPPRGMWVLNCV